MQILRKLHSNNLKEGTLRRGDENPPLTRTEVYE